MAEVPIPVTKARQRPETGPRPFRLDRKPMVRRQLPVAPIIMNETTQIMEVRSALAPFIRSSISPHQSEGISPFVLMELEEQKKMIRLLKMQQAVTPSPNPLGDMVERSAVSTIVSLGDGIGTLLNRLFNGLFTLLPKAA